MRETRALTADSTPEGLSRCWQTDNLPLAGWDHTSMSAQVVSREIESHAIADFLTATVAEPHGLVIEGEPGIGKTTLWLTAVQQARERGFRVLSARAASAESVLAYASLADLLRGVEETAQSTLPEPQRTALDRALLRTDTDGAATDQQAVAAGFLSVVEGLANEAPVLVAIDDLQWLDPSTVAVVAFAARRLSGPVGVIATLRSDDQRDVAGWLRMDRPDAVRRLRVPPLSLGALHAIISERLGHSFARPTLVRVHEISGGNPFYALELARSMEGAGGRDAPLPCALIELVRARIGSLGPGVQEALLAISCLAAPTVELVAQATCTGIAHVVEALEDAEEQGIIGFAGQRIHFTHPLLARGVYTEATPARRRGMHRRLAGIVEQPELQARHLALAATSADRQTLQALDVAVEAARSRGAPAAAAELLDLAFGLGGDTQERRILLAGCLFNSGDGARARVQLEKVAAGPAPRTIRAEALNLLAVMSLLDGSALEATELLERALGEAADNLELRTRILVSLSWAQLNIGQLAASARSIEDAVTNAERLRRPQLLSQALGMGVVVNLLLGNGLDDRNLCRALELEKRNAATSGIFRPTVQSALVVAWTGQLDAAHDQLLAIRQDCIEHGEESELVFVAFHSALVEIWRGNFTDATLIAEDAVERALQLDGVLPLSVALTVRAMLAVYAGREDDARRDVSDAINPMLRTNFQLATWPVAVLGFLEVSRNTYDAALKTLEPILVRLEAAPNATEIFVAWFVPDAIEAMIHVGRHADAEALIDRLERNGQRLDRPWMLAVGARCRSMLLAARGDIETANHAAQRAMVEHDRLPMPFERARTQLLVGQLQRRQLHKDAASATLHEALRTFEDMSTPLWADRARAELARTNVHPRSAAEGLTPSEQRVAELAASGMTNRDVAAALFISSKTVEANLARVYHKLDIHSRAELGRRVSGPDR